MAIDLPPAIPPQLTGVEQMEIHAEGRAPYVATVGDFEMRITGDHQLSEDELSRIVRASETPSQVIQLMNSLSMRKGNLLITPLYAVQGGVIHVHAMQGTVVAVEGEEEILPYFRGLEENSELKRSEFDRARVMAGIRSQRTGVDYGVSYRIDDKENPVDVALIFDGKPRADHDATDLILQFGNQGSRFVGRYFADAGLTHNFGNGTRLALGYQRAIPELGEARDGDDYHQFQVSLDHPFRFGLYGIDASYMEYTQEVRDIPVTQQGCVVADPLLGVCVIDGSSTGTTDIELDAEIMRVGLSGEQVLSSDLNRRFNLFQRLEYVDSVIEGGGFKPQDENYTTLELGAKYHRAARLWGQGLRWNLAASIKGGVTGDSGTLGSERSFEEQFGEPPPSVSPARRTAEFVTFMPRATARLLLSERSRVGIDFSAQISDEQLPQQQQWVLGGINTISAYMPGVLVGDTGYYAELSYDYRWPLGGFGELTLALFGEYGAARFENARGANGDTRSIVDAGIRLTAELWDTLTLEAVAAESLSERNFDDRFLERNEADFFFRIRAVF